MKKLTDAERQERRVRKSEDQREARKDPAARAAFNARRRELHHGAERLHRGKRWQGGHGPLADRLRLELGSGGFVESVTALSDRTDPYRQDCPRGHQEGKWLAEHLRLAAPDGRVIHLRGLHYLLASRGDVVLPDGKRYVNSPECYQVLGFIGKSARWLGYVPFERIIDNRNDEPVIALHVEQGSREGWAEWNPPYPVEMPSFVESTPEISLSGGHVPQPYRIILIGEKSSLRSELEPLREQVGGELILPTGELSDTLINGMCARAVADPRPSVVLYFSDFDPSGHQMPISLARKLQAIRDLKWPELTIEVHSAALTLEQCLSLDLPSTPLKDTEKRAGNWQAKFGREQTEIDALAALHPGELRRIAREAVAPFFDFTLAGRVSRASADWYEAAEQVLDGSPEYQAEIAQLAKRQAGAKATIAEAVSDANAAQEAAMEAIEALDLEFDPFDPPGVELSTKAPRPLFDSRDSWAEQTRRLIERKALGGDDDDS